MTEQNIILADLDEWNAFVRDNFEALREQYGTIEKAYQHATQGGLTLGGGAAPLVTITFAE